MEKHRRDVDGDAANIYDSLFTTAGGDDNQGNLGGPDGSLVAVYRDWYRAAPGGQQLEIQYQEPKPNNLLGHYLPHPSLTKRTAIVIHGVTSKWENTGPWVRVFYEMGFNIFTPDLRGHGANEQFSQDRTMGIYDSKDMITWIGKIKDTVGEDAQIVMMGYSLGAAVGLQAISYTDVLPPNVLAMVEDSGFEDLPTMVKADIVNNQYSQVDEVYAKVDDMLFANQKAHIEDGISVNSIKAGRVPLLVIYGSADPVVWPIVSLDIYNNYQGSPKLIYEVQGAGHPECISYGYQPYREQVRDFLVQARVLPCKLGFQPDSTGSSQSDFPPYPEVAPQTVELAVYNGAPLPGAVQLAIFDDDKTGTTFAGGSRTALVNISQVSRGPTVVNGRGTMPALTLGRPGRFSIVARAQINSGLGQSTATELRTFKTA